MNVQKQGRRLFVFGINKMDRLVVTARRLRSYYAHAHAPHSIARHAACACSRAGLFLVARARGGLRGGLRSRPCGRRGIADSR
jgi:hypothetical protein